ncbi:RICIN domain-containing protein [Hufsiella ginkgonis]|uniref:Ricin B lectin domain-containing protein n=1 Tax=Hufsiella ginkgonis TaxID=2695274 RepID=A0A7K1Y1U5_9SPHI|nr:RICIN domain-containing protein [Hufsiella ginkgonis]MXV17230.1 hypothetical protein [Hufsiella ginkgonis]
MKKAILFLCFVTMIVTGCSEKPLVTDPEVLLPGNKNKLTTLATDPFAAYLTSTPAIFSTISTTNSGSGASAITVKRFTFKSRGGVNTVFGIMAYPQQAGTYPGILLLHGGGGNAETMAGYAQTFAARGYVTLAVDLPGICGTGNTPNSSGPWKSKPAGEGPRFVVTPTPDESTLADAEIAGLEGFNLLAAQTTVNSARMGIYGISWGGYSTTMLSGLLGSRVTASYAQYGCGFYDRGSFWTGIINGLSPADRNTWLTYFDAGRRAGNLRAAYFIEAPTNDTYFWPPAVTATLNAITVTKNQVFTPNLNHAATANAATMRNIYFDHYLKAAGVPFGSIKITGVTTQADGSRLVTMNATMPAGVSVSSAQLYYSEPTTTWQNRAWVAVNASLVSGTTYSAVVPSSSAAKGSDFYAYCQDSRGVVVSSTMQRTADPVVLPDGIYKIVNRTSGLALDAKGALTANGTPVQQWTYSGGNNQRWNVTSLGNGQYRIVGIQSNRSLEVTGQSVADGAKLQIFDSSAGDNQKWIITRTSGGYYSVKGVQSNKMMEVPGHSTVAGALIQIWTSTGSNSQQWAFQTP